MAKKTLGDGAICLMNYLMNVSAIHTKVFAAGEEGRSYRIYKVHKNGKVILGETKYSWWNQLVGCQVKLPFESWALAVWDALVDLSSGDNQLALERGLSVEIANEAQRSENYEGIVKRLYDCYEKVCNNKGGAPSEGGRDDKGSSMTGTRTVYCNNEPVTININGNGFKRTLRYPDATGRAFLDFELGIVGVHARKD